MQLGTRWSVGTQPPASLPEPVIGAVQQVESDVAGIDTKIGRAHV